MRYRNRNRYLKRLQNKLSTISSETEGQRSCGDFKAAQSGKIKKGGPMKELLYNNISETETIIHCIQILYIYFLGDFLIFFSYYI
jgi:hypothetical protein